MSGPLQWPLFFGAFPVGLLVGAAAGGGFLLFRTHRRWRTRVLPAVAAGSVLATVALAWIVNSVWQPFPDPLPIAVLVWASVIAAAAALAVAHVYSAHWWRKAIAVLAGITVIAAGMNQINRVYGYYPTAAAALGLPLAQERSLPPVQLTTTQPAGRAADPAYRQRWIAPAGMPRGGAVSRVDIPGTTSSFPARPAWVYLPPAYLTAHRPNLPVLMLLPGQPGTSRDWIDGGRIIATMDAFAALHGGLAPVVVMPDPLGSSLANPLCADTSLGNADTYLAKDVPAWIVANLQVDRSTTHWAVGGFSFGGTCSLQLAVLHPDLFPTFLDIAGQSAPSLGSPGRTLARAFHGDARAFAMVNPLDILAAHRPAGTTHGHESGAFVHVAGTLVVGSVDRGYAWQQRQVQAATVAAGMSIRWLEVAGSHTWHTAASAAAQSLPWLADRMGLSR